MPTVDTSDQSGSFDFQIAKFIINVSDFVIFEMFSTNVNCYDVYFQIHDTADITFTLKF